MSERMADNSMDGIAIIGMAGRLPGAQDLPAFWENLKAGVESISHFTAQELEVSDPELAAKLPNYVRARSILDRPEMFDASFFGFYPKEAELIDPQQRVFLECCWHAFENAGYDPFTYPGAVGVFAGCSANTYFLRQICATREFLENYSDGYQVENYPVLLGSNADFLSTRVSYKLNLRGPSFTIQAGCATSLIAIVQACQNLLTFQCDMALAGGVSITFPQKRGYRYQPEGMVSPDGHCRAFDAKAQGTVFGSGAGVVLLKRLEEAMADGDPIYAVIKGSAVTNDGSAKAGFAAPGVEGQARVIAMAQAAAGINPETISYIEAHGTGTPLGDPIEIAALTKAFRAGTDAKGFCAIGTAKSNVGHLDIAAGVTGVIKTALALDHKMLPASLHYERPNPAIDFENSPFYVNSELREWRAGTSPRRAGVSAFGIGGGNAHVVLEEAPPRQPSTTQRSQHLLLLSAKSESALEMATANLADHLRQNPDASLADVGYTLQVGRHAFDHRRMLVASDASDAVQALEARDPKRAFGSSRQYRNAAVAFLFPGQGAQYPNMGRELYATERIFREQMDLCSEILKPHLGLDLRHMLYPAAELLEESRGRLSDTVLTQPALFATEYALARLWMSWGVHPQAMIGHSVGEFVAACLAGVFSLEDALGLIAARGRLMQDLPGGAMLSVRLPENQARPLLNGSLSLAAVNSPAQCVIAGPTDAVEALEKRLEERGVTARRLSTSHAFHSAMMDPIVQPFTERVKQVRLHSPEIPYISGVTGTWITAAEATDPNYWARHFREPVLYSEGIRELKAATDRILVEVGPGNILSTLARQHGPATDPPAIRSLPDASAAQTDGESLWNAAGRLWLAGVQLDWAAIHAGERRYRVPLPLYPFERKRYWVELPQPRETANPAVHALALESPGPETSTEENHNAMSESPTAAVAATTRQERIRCELKAMFEDLSGVDLSAVEGSTTFLELGFDSLFLTQVTQALQGKFDLKITFRQLLDQESTLDALAAYADARLRPEVFAPAPSEPRPVPTAAPLPSAAASSADGMATPDATTVERIMREQLQAMSQLISRQLGMLGGLPAAASGPVASVPVEQPLETKPAAPQAQTQPAPAPQPEFKPFGPYKPVQKGPSGGLTSRQEKYLYALIERYTGRTKESKRLTQAYRRVLADPRAASGFRAQWKEMVYPIVTVRSKGSRLWDVDGNEYIDILNGFGPTMFGHAPDFVVEAVEKQLKDGFEIGPQSPIAGKVAALVCELTGAERATFCNTGSEAVMAAMRVARTVTGRQKIVFFAGAYHGTFDEVLVKGIKRGGVPGATPIAPGIPPEKAANAIVLEYGAPESLEYIRQHARELAAVLVEPVQSRHPKLQPREFLREIREITAQSGTALIFDEVVTGFRVHPGGVQALFDIRADLVTYGKVIGGGLPIGILAGKASFMDALDGGMWQYGDDSFPEVGVTFFAGTFVRHPLALAATHAVLNHLKDSGPELQARLGEKTAYLVQSINNFFEQNQVPARIENFGSIFYFSFPSDQRFGSLLYYHLREKGVHIQEGFPCFLTTAHTDADIEHIIRAFQDSVIEMQEGGVLPARETAVPAVVPQVERAETVIESPVTDSQMEIWLAAHLSPEASCAYNESFTLHLRGSLDTGALTASIQEVIARHDALRATFNEKGDRLLIHPTLTMDLPLLDLSSKSREARDAEIGRMVSDDARLPFDLINGPLIRIRLVKLEEQHHLVLVTTHHMICDGWSTNVILDELAKLYSAKCQGLRCELPRPMRFGDYARNQAELYQTPDGRKIEEFWAKQFSTPALLLDLPTDRPRPSVRTFRGATERRRIGGSIYREIKRAGAQQKCTLFATLLGGFQFLLSRLSGQDDIVVGIPAAGQSLLDGQTLVGHCVNFLPVRCPVVSSSTAKESLAQVKRVLLDAYEHQNYTYGRLVRKLGLRGDPSRLPLTEVQFNLERVGAGSSFAGLEGDVDPNPKSFVNFDLFLNVIETDDGLVLDCDYNSDLFDRETIQRWLGHYQTLIEGLASDANQTVARLPLLTEAERNRILVEWNRTEEEYPRTRPIHQLFEEQVARAPKRVAAVFGETSLTYTELNAKANQLARYLQKLGVGPNVLVGIYLDRSLEMIVGLLGILKAGGAYLPLDPGHPKDRLAFILEETGVPLLVTKEKLGVDLAPGKARAVCLDADRDLIAHESGADLPPKTGSGDLAYVIYTSGSTGKPKGVEITHRAAVNLLCSMRRIPGIEAGDALLAVTTLSFDIAALELFLPLIAGARVVIAPREAVGDGDQLMALLEACGITVMQATPATWRLLLEAGWKGSPGLKLLCGGEALPRELASRLLGCGSSLWNMYGPTETTIWSAASRVEPDSGAVPIGRPIANTQFFVLDPAGEPTPIGVPGELHIGGDGVARGYFHRRELTADRFVPDAFRKEPGARLYKTGDLVRYCPDGTIEFLGRLDNQVKVRGFRIELGEIEALLIQYPGVREAVVVTQEDASGDKRLVAYVAASPQPASGDLRGFLGQQLPDYMVPAIFVGIEALPRTPNGKVDRRSLPAPDPEKFRGEAPYVAPRSSLERQLADIWAEVLYLDRVGIEDNVFDLGADSIHLFQITARANRAGISLSPQQLLLHRTIAALSGELHSMNGGLREAVASAIVPIPREKYRKRRPESEWART
jgi:amino acid adenylation domain-containing protein